MCDDSAWLFTSIRMLLHLQSAKNSSLANSRATVTVNNVVVDGEGLHLPHSIKF